MTASKNFGFRTRGGLCAPLLISATLLAGCDRINFRSEGDYVERARVSAAKGDYKSSIVEARNALQKNPRNVDARLMLAEGLLRTGSAGEAEIALKQALDNGADEEVVAVSLGRAILLQDDYKRVLSDVTVSSAAPPAHAAKLLAIRGEAQLEMGRFDDAKKSFDQAVADDADLPEALIGQAHIAYAQSQNDRATTLIDRVLDRTPSNLAAVLLRGDIARSRGQYDDASAAYQKVLNVDPNNLVALAKIAALELGTNRIDAAEKHIASIGKNSGAQTLYTYLTAFLEFRKGNFVVARESIQKSLTLAPASIPVVALAGAIEYGVGSDEQAEKYLRQALAAVPNAPVVRKLLVATLLRKGQIQDAVRLLKAALDQAPTDLSLLTLAGETYMKAGDYASANTVLAKAVALDPKALDTRMRLSVSQLAAGDTAGALADLDLAMKSEEDGYQAEVLMIVAAMARKDYGQAAKSIEMLERKQPTNPLTFNFKGGLLLASKDTGGARAAFEHALALDPTYVPAAINLGHLDVAENRPEDAKKRFIAILDKDPKQAEAAMALVDLGRLTGTTDADMLAVLNRTIAAAPRAAKPLIAFSRLSLRDEPRKALEAAQKAVAILPNDPAALDALGGAQVATGEERGALATYTKLVEVAPSSSAAKLHLAWLLNENANPQAASRLLRKALEKSPHALDVQTALVSVDLVIGNVTEALKVARQVQTDAPNAPFGYLLEGDALIVSKLFVKAAASYDRAYSLVPNSGVAIKVCAAYTAAGQPNVGETRLKEWLKRSPDDMAGRYYLAATAAKRRNFPLAIEQYQAILQNRPDDAVTLNDLSIAYEEVKDPRALQTAEAAYKSKPGEAPINDTLGWLLVERGQTERGVKLLRTAASIAPGVVQIRMHLARGLLKAGDQAAARTELESVVNRRESFPERRDAEVLLAEIAGAG